ncbi:MAG: VOC family protein [Polyangiaceae bacterium]|nr:VOC family protein [Polyangiaceae bacterium]
MSNVQLPAGHHTVTPAIVVPEAARLIEFLKHAFGGVEVARHASASGHVAHAEVEIGDSIVMLGEPTGDSLPRPAVFTVYVDDCDATYQRAIAAGARPLHEPRMQSYGHRVARVQDECENQWSIHAVIAHISHDEQTRSIPRSAGR